MGTIVLRKQVFDPDHLYKMSRHFVWLIPLSNLVRFPDAGIVRVRRRLVWPRRGRWLFTRSLCALTLLPAILVAFPRIYSLAWLVVALGVAARLVPLFERRGRVLRRFVVVSFPAAIAIVVDPGGIALGRRPDQASARECAALAAAGVAERPLDRAGHRRGGPPEPAWLRPGHQHDPGRARRARDPIRFRSRGLVMDAAVSCDHVYRTMVARALGRLAHSARPNTSHAGRVPRRPRAMRRPVSSPTRLTVPPIRDWPAALHVTRISSSPSSPRSRWPCWSIEPGTASRRIVYFTENWLESAGLLPYVRTPLAGARHRSQGGGGGQSRAPRLAVATAAQPERPFFAFLNYFDAHYPYQLPPGRLHRFGVEPTDNYHRILIQHWWELDKTTVSPEDVAFAADLYDDCIADLDEQLGRLVDELERRGILEQTWLIITVGPRRKFR